MAYKQSPYEGFQELALFAGIGGGILGGHLLGWKTICAVEIDSYAAGILAVRQNDGILPPFPIWDDILTFDGRPWRGIVDVVSGGIPCVDISAAKRNAEGINGPQSGLWREMFRIIGEVRPRYAFIENSPFLRVRGIDRVLIDLAGIGYDAAWGCLSAGAFGAPHERNRMWILASDAEGERPSPGDASSSDAPTTGGGRRSEDPGQLFELGNSGIWALPRPYGAVPVGMDNGVPETVDAIRALGNAQVPFVAGKAFQTLWNRFHGG